MLGVNYAFCQLANGSAAPDFTVDIIDKNSPTAPPTGAFSLSAETGQGKGVCLTFSATWCGPCWNFHNSGVIESIYSQYGPGGTNEVAVLFVEADTRTNRDCMFNLPTCNFGTSQGDWTNVPYDMTDIGPGNSPGLANQYAISFFPTLYVVSPDMRVYQITSRTLATYESWLLHSFKLNATGTTTNALCFNDGAVDIDVTGGFGNLRYNWSNGAKTEDLVGVPAGSYSVTITDQNGYDKVFGPFNVDGPTTPLSINTLDQQNILCNGVPEGSISVSGQGGTPGYSYNWSNGATTSEIFGLAAGNYTVTILDNNNCESQKSYLITEPFPLLMDLEESDEHCDQMNGRIVADGYGGTPPYEYSLDGGNFDFERVFPDLSAGTYEVETRDANGCLTSDFVEIDNVPGPEAEIEDPDILGCGRDSVTLSGEGSATGNSITYSWTTTEGNIIRGENSLTPDIDEPGAYYFEVVDTLTGCLSMDSVVVEEDTSVIARPGMDTLVNCINPEIVIDASNTSQGMDIIYQWTTNGGQIISGDTTLMPTVGEAGTYILTAMDTITGCTDIDSVNVDEDIAEPDLEIAEPEVLDCIMTEVSLDASGSSSGPDFTIEWTTLDGNIVSGENTLNPVVDGPGEYTLTITNNSNGCSSMETTTVLQEINEPLPDFNYAVDTLSVQFTDRSEGDPTDWSWDFGDGNTSDQASPVHVYGMPGTYTACLTITNVCGSETTCEDVQVGFGLILSSYVIGDVSCSEGNDGYIDVTITGGIEPYTFEWSNGSQEEDLNDLSAGEYMLTITDGAGAILNFTFEVAQPDPMEQENVTITNAIEGVQGGSIDLEVTGGTEPYSYNWSNGESTSMIEGLEPGMYTCIVTDANGCEFTFGPFTVGSMTNTRSFETLESLDVFPNPVSDLLYVNISYTEHLNTLIRLTSVSGSVAYQNEWEGKQAEISIDISGIPAGTYLLSIVTKDGTAAELISVVK